jgi:hypothetical protein
LSSSSGLVGDYMSSSDLLDKKFFAILNGVVVGENLMN